MSFAAGLITGRNDKKNQTQHMVKVDQSVNPPPVGSGCIGASIIGEEWLCCKALRVGAARKGTHSRAICREGGERADPLASENCQPQASDSVSLAVKAEPRTVRRRISGRREAATLSLDLMAHSSRLYFTRAIRQNFGPKVPKDMRGHVVELLRCKTTNNKQVRALYRTTIKRSRSCKYGMFVLAAIRAGVGDAPNLRCMAAQSPDALE
jgi:hypothetical protein